MCSLLTSSLFSLSPSTLPVFLHGNFRQRTSSLPFHAPPQLDLCTISSALHFSYSTVLLERGWRGVDGWGGGWGCGRGQEEERGRRENCRDGRLPPPTRQKCWMTVLQIGAEAKLLTSERYSFTCTFNSPALIWRDQERQQELGKGRRQGLFSHIRSGKCQM